MHDALRVTSDSNLFFSQNIFSQNMLSWKLHVVTHIHNASSQEVEVKN